MKHKVYFKVHSLVQWYDIIHEAKSWFGKDWRAQRGVRKKFDLMHWQLRPHRILHKQQLITWFLVPDPSFRTWVELKYTKTLNRKNK
jgi:hypothetical protein